MVVIYMFTKCPLIILKVSTLLFLRNEAYIKRFIIHSTFTIIYLMALKNSKLKEL